jgi:rSAM/selenodomain-associated transferase 1
MAKEPRAGRVKTRLCPPLSAEMASRCHEAFVTDTLARVAAAVAGRADRELAVAPSGAVPRLRALAAAAGWRCVDQEGEDLGARMRSRLVAGVAEGKRRVILLGSDSPDLPADRILRAFAALEEAEVVLGPAIDGGYYLIGCRDRVPDVFGQGIGWGGAVVLKDTLARLDASGTSVALLEPWRDVDDWPDLVALAARLRVAGEKVGNPAPKATIGVLEELGRQGLAL